MEGGAEGLEGRFGVGLVGGSFSCEVWRGNRTIWVFGGV